MASQDPHPRRHFNHDAGILLQRQRDQDVVAPILLVEVDGQEMATSLCVV
jgi:hypothetical protein